MLRNPQSDIFKLGLYGCATSTRAHFTVRKEYEILCQSSGKSVITFLNQQTCGDEN